MLAIIRHLLIFSLLLSACCIRMPAQSFSERSVYQTTSAWTTQNGEVLRLRDLKGAVVVTTMIFTSCTYACPQIMADINRISRSLPADAARDTRFVFITMDVARDTAATLKAFAQTMGVDQPGWIFLHGTADDTREIAALLGIKFKRMRDSSFSHSNVITVLDRAGEIVHQQVGLNAKPEPTVDAVIKAVSKAY